MTDPEVIDLLGRMRNAVSEAQEALDAVREDLDAQGRPEGVDDAVRLREISAGLAADYEALYELLLGEE
ncbi:MAG: hypothetical protein M3R38_03805 [Actinomycetota bacterium]|nr:hypothetical protein [Actinomycetota bacterium]